MRTCDRVLGDAKCGVDTSAPEFSVEAVAAAGSSGAVLGVEGDLTAYAAEWFVHGRVVWIDGRNAGTSQSVKADRVLSGGGREVELWQEPPAGLQAGDRFRLVSGCDKRAESCRAKFVNFMNFRGFPHIPGEDWVTAYPRRGQGNTGRSLRNG